MYPSFTAQLAALVFWVFLVFFLFLRAAFSCGCFRCHNGNKKHETSMTRGLARFGRTISHHSYRPVDQEWGRWGARQADLRNRRF